MMIIYVLDVDDDVYVVCTPGLNYVILRLFTSVNSLLW